MMLLSTDWFSSHWSVLGIVVSKEQTCCLMHECRNIVKYVMNGKREYAQVDFSSERQGRTCQMFDVAVMECGIDKRSASILKNMSAEDPSRGNSQSWLWLAITQKLVKTQAHMEPTDMRMPSHIATTIVNSFEKYEAPGINFEILSNRSRSEWDRYIRQLIPDQPTAVADFVSAELIPERMIDRLWDDIRQQLSYNDRSALRDWYRAQALEIAGQDVSPPLLDLT